MNKVRLSVLAFLAIACTPAIAQLQYIPLPAPCRAIDTRLSGGPIGAGTAQVFDPGRACGIPNQGSQPIAFATNVTVVPHGPLGYLTVWGTGSAQPLASILNSVDGRIKSNYAIVLGGVNTDYVSVYATNTTDLILDISGYFIEAPATGATMLYTPVTSCRLIDTRNSAGALGGPSLTANQQRTFQLANQCGLPSLSNGGALSVNVTAVPKGSLGFLTVWGTSQAENALPATSSLNSPGTVVANAAFLTINPSTNNSISAYASNDTDLIVDVTGYFSQSTTGMAYYPTGAPQRILDTRTQGGAAVTGEQTVAATTGPAVLVLNATAVPVTPLWVLTLWPDGKSEPSVSTLNSWDSAITSNMAIVNTGSNGSIDAFADGSTQLIFDLAGSFMTRPVATAGPLVEFLGDEISAGLVAAAGNPNWQCYNCVSSTTSADVLANLPAVIASKPALVHVLVGAHELAGSPTDPQADNGAVPLGNIGAMVNMLQAAKIPVLIGDMPPCSAIDSYRFNIALGITYGGGFAGFSGQPLVSGATFVDYSGIGGGAGVQSNPTCPGHVDPNSLGYADMAAIAQAAVTQATASVQHEEKQ
jgi:hypothetical protein